MVLTAIDPSPNNTKKAVYTTEKLGTDLTRKEYGTHIFARVNFADHVFWQGYGPVLFSGLGP